MGALYSGEVIHGGLIYGILRHVKKIEAQAKNGFLIKKRVFQILRDVIIFMKLFTEVNPLIISSFLPYHPFFPDKHTFNIVNMSVSKLTGQLLSNDILFQIQVSTEKLANIASIGSNH